MDNREFMGMSRKELAKEVRRLARNANRRISNLQRLSAESPALRYAMDTGGKFYTANKTLNQLRAEFKRVNQFLSYKTSTVAGFKQYRVDTLNRLGLTEQTTSKELENNIWKAYRRIEEYSPGIVKSYGSEEMQRFVSERAQKGKNVDTIVEASINELNEWYEREYSDEWAEFDASDIFDMGEN